MDNKGISENAGTILIIAVLAVVAIIVTLMVTDIAGGATGLEKPTFAMFEAKTIMGYDRAAPHNIDIPVIKLSKVGGDEIDIRYSEGSHSGFSGTKLYLYDPNGNTKEITQSITMRGDSIEAGEDYYIFYYDIGEGSNIWMTNDITRINGGSGVERFSPSGTWRIVIVDDDNMGTIILNKKFEL